MSYNTIYLLDLIRPVISHGKFNSGKYGKDQYDRVVSTIDFWLGQIIKNVDLKKTLIIITSDHGTYPSSININNKNYRLEPGILYKILWKIGFRLPPNLIPLWVKLNNLYRIFFKWKKDRLAKKLNLSSYQKRIFLNAIGHTRDIHDDCLLIPLIFFGYGIKSSLLISQPVRQIDIFPTVLSILKIKNEDVNVDGISLLPLIEGKKLNSIPSYIESLPTRENGWKKIIGIRTGNYKYGRNIKDSNKDIVLYDITADPLEEHNLATNKPEIVERLENILNEIIKSPQKITKATSMSDEEIKKIENELKKLGYV